MTTAVALLVAAFAFGASAAHALTFCVSGADYVAIQSPAGTNRECRPIADDAVTMTSAMICRGPGESVQFLIKSRDGQSDDRLDAPNVTVRVHMFPGSMQLIEQFAIHRSDTDDAGFFIATHPDKPAALRQVTRLEPCPAGDLARAADIVDPARLEFEPWRQLMRRFGRWPQ